VKWEQHIGASNGDDPNSLSDAGEHRIGSWAVAHTSSARVSLEHCQPEHRALVADGVDTRSAASLRATTAAQQWPGVLRS